MRIEYISLEIGQEIGLLVYEDFNTLENGGMVHKTLLLPKGCKYDPCYPTSYHLMQTLALRSSDLIWKTFKNLKIAGKSNLDYHILYTRALKLLSKVTKKIGENFKVFYARKTIIEE